MICNFENENNTSSPEISVEFSDKMVLSSLDILQRLLLSPPYDQEDEEFNAVVTNTVSGFVFVMEYIFGSEKLTSDENAFGCVERVVEKMLELLPLEGDDDESNNQVYPRLIKMSKNDENPLFGKKSGKHHETLVETLKNVVGLDVYNDTV